MLSSSCQNIPQCSRSQHLCVFILALVPVNPSPPTSPITQNPLSPVFKESAAVSSGSEVFVKNQEPDPDSHQEGQLFQKCVLKVWSHRKQRGCVSAPNIWMSNLIQKMRTWTKNQILVHNFSSVCLFSFVRCTGFSKAAFQMLWPVLMLIFQTHRMWQTKGWIKLTWQLFLTFIPCQCPMMLMGFLSFSSSFTFLFPLFGDAQLQQN